MISKSMKQVKNEQMPFYSWQCLTLQLSHRDIDLVIPNQQEMDDLLEMLVDSLNTVNGNRNSADAIKQLIHTDKYLQELNR